MRMEQSLFDGVDAYVEQQMRRLSIPGASLAIIEGDRMVHLRGFGRARPGGRAPTPRTPFAIGSLAKSITALAVMQLVEEGQVELDAPVRRYLPWFRVASPEVSARMTVRHLLNQTSGLPSLAGEIALADLDQRPDATERQVRALATLRVSRQPGSKCEYSNLNYNILGLIVEVASGETYTGYIQRRIFEPLGMSHSYTSQAVARVNGLATGYRHWFGRPVPAPSLPVPRGSLPSGQLFSCAEDMARYLIAHLNGGRYGGAQVLSAPGIDELHRGVAEYVAAGFSAGLYGMGWYERYMGEIRVLAHAGNVPEHSAFMALLPERNRGVVVLFSADPYGLPPLTDEVGMGLAAVLAGQRPEPVRLGYVPWIMRFTPLVPLLQVVGVFATLRSLRSWGRDPALRPGRARTWGLHVLLPLIPNLILAALLGYLRVSGLLRFMRLYMPDLSWIAGISGGFAMIWALLRTGLVLHSLRRPRCG